MSKKISEMSEKELKELEIRTKLEIEDILRRNPKMKQFQAELQNKLYNLTLDEKFAYLKYEMNKNLEELKAVTNYLTLNASKFNVSSTSNSEEE